MEGEMNPVNLDPWPLPQANLLYICSLSCKSESEPSLILYNRSKIGAITASIQILRITGQSCKY